MSARRNIDGAIKACVLFVLVSVLILPTSGFCNDREKTVAHGFKARVIENMAYQQSALIVEKTPAKKVIHKRILVLITDETKIGFGVNSIHPEDLAVGTSVVIKGDPRIEKAGDRSILIVEAHSIRPVLH